MRLLLDAHVSGPSVGRPLGGAGHDVRALDQEADLAGLDDEVVLALATSEARVVVTCDVSDFPPILQQWAETGRSHAGVILVYGIRQDEFGLLVRGVERWIEQRPRQEEWVNFPAVVTRAFASG